MTARDEAIKLIDSHVDLTREYREQRLRVTNAEVYGLVDPELAASLEAHLTCIYKMLHDQAAGIASLNARLAFEEIAEPAAKARGEET